MKHGPKRFQLLSTTGYCDEHGKSDFDTDDGTTASPNRNDTVSDLVDAMGSQTDDVPRKFDCVARSGPRNDTPDDNITKDDTSKDDTSDVDMSADDTSRDPHACTDRGLIGESDRIASRAAHGESDHATDNVFTANQSLTPSPTMSPASDTCQQNQARQPTTTRLNYS